ncbi:MAG TPA: (2Fe-2S)-binding protein [Pyrinomonadaceae bacterium]|nr:(2Fe-2S)-binding protein [Pyrinomonadaceae bacterium]
MRYQVDNHRGKLIAMRSPAEIISGPDAIERSVTFAGRATSISCGAIARVTLCVDEAQAIRRAEFKVLGCSVLVAALANLTEQIKDRTTAEAAGIAEDLNLIETQLGGVDSDRGSCVLLASEALLEAVRAYSDSAREQWEGDDPLICTCFGVSESRIQDEVGRKKLNTIADVTRECNAGAGCRSCHPLIADIIEEVLSAEC